MVAFFLAAAVATTATSMQVYQIEAEALATRSAITSCDISIRLVGRIVYAQGDTIEYDKSLRYRMDDDKLRVDVYGAMNSPKSDGDNPVRHKIMCRNCVLPGYTTSYTHLVSGVLTVPNGSQGSSSVGSFTELFDPRKIGCCLEQFLSLKDTPIDSDVKRQDRQFASLISDRYRDQPAWLIRGTTIKAGAKHRLWIVPGLGYAVGRIEASGENAKGQEWSYLLDSHPQQWGQAGIWYPKSYTYRMNQPGSVLIEEHIDVTSASFNNEIDPTVFSLESMEIADGTPVSIQPEGEMRFWDKSRVVDSPPADLFPAHKLNRVQSGGARSTRLLYIGSGLLLTFIACILFLRRYRTANRT